MQVGALVGAGRRRSAKVRALVGAGRRRSAQVGAGWRILVGPPNPDFYWRYQFFPQVFYISSLNKLQDFLSTCQHWYLISAQINVPTNFLSNWHIYIKEVKEFWFGSCNFCQPDFRWWFFPVVTSSLVLLNPTKFSSFTHLWKIKFWSSHRIQNSKNHQKLIGFAFLEELLFRKVGILKASSIYEECRDKIAILGSCTELLFQSYFR